MVGCVFGGGPRLWETKCGLSSPLQGCAPVRRCENGVPTTITYKWSKPLFRFVPVFVTAAPRLKATKTRKNYFESIGAATALKAQIDSDDAWSWARNANLAHLEGALATVGSDHSRFTQLMLTSDLPSVRAATDPDQYEIHLHRFADDLDPKLATLIGVVRRLSSMHRASQA